MEFCWTASVSFQLSRSWPFLPPTLSSHSLSELWKKRAVWQCRGALLEAGNLQKFFFWWSCVLNYGWLSRCFTRGENDRLQPFFVSLATKMIALTEHKWWVVVFFRAELWKWVSGQEVRKSRLQSDEALSCVTRAANSIARGLLFARVSRV